MATDKSLISAVKKHFPSAVNADGVVDRTELGKIVFKDIVKRKLLNRLTHKRIFKEMFLEIFKLRVIEMK